MFLYKPQLTGKILKKFKEIFHRNQEIATLILVLSRQSLKKKENIRNAIVISKFIFFDFLFENKAKKSVKEKSIEEPGRKL